jgi:CheY-like chemotaxis protein
MSGSWAVINLRFIKEKGRGKMKSVEKKKVLIVEDNRDLRSMYEAYFEMEKMEVISAENGEQALELIRQCPPDVVLTDYQMPKLDGGNLVRIIREEEVLRGANRKLPIVVMTAGTLEKISTACQYEAVVGFMKSFTSLHAMIDKVKEMVQEHTEAPQSLIAVGMC